MVLGGGGFVIMFMCCREKRKKRLVFLTENRSPQRARKRKTGLRADLLEMGKSCWLAVFVNTLREGEGKGGSSLLSSTQEGAPPDHLLSAKRGKKKKKERGILDLQVQSERQSRFRPPREGEGGEKGSC